jgi:hypothetical protein
MFPPNLDEIIRTLESEENEYDIATVRETLLNALTVNIVPCKIHETPLEAEFCVESIAGDSFNDYLNSFRGQMIEYYRQLRLDDSALYQVPCAASNKSKSDGIVCSKVELNEKVKLIGTGVVELKDTAFSPFEQQGQAFVTGCNFILGQLKYGLLWDHCYVAIMSTNGQLYQFGFISLLEMSFPVLHITSYVLDLTNPDQEKVVAKHLNRFRSFCVKQDEKIRNCTTRARGDIYISLNERKYFSKPIKDLFLRCSTKLQSLLNVYKIFQKLRDNHFEVYIFFLYL